LSSTDDSESPQPTAELLDLLRSTFREAVAHPDGEGPSRDVVERLGAAARRQGIRGPAEVLPLIRAAWATLPDVDGLPAERREALLHRVTSALIETHYGAR
jgi:hypothetical protein